MKEKKNLGSRLGKSAKFLMVNDALYTLTALFIETFLVAYFLKVTNDSIVQVSAFYVIIYLLLGLGNIAIGKVVKLNTKHRARIMSIGIILRAVFILFIVILREDIAVYFPIVAIVYGVSEVFYWVAHEALAIDVTTKENRKNYMSSRKILGKIIHIVAPIVLGSSIELYSFNKIAIFVFVVSVIQILISLQVKTDIKKSVMNTKYSIKEFLKKYDKKYKKKINNYSRSAFFYGTIESSIQTLVVIITVMTFKTSLNLGILTSIFAVLSMIALYWFKKHYNKNTAKVILFVLAGAVVISVVGLLIDIDKVTLIIYNLVYTSSIAILGTIYDTKKGDLVKECKLEKWKEEWVVYMDLCITSGRILGYVMMLIVGLINTPLAFNILLAVVTICVPIYAKFMWNVEKE